MDISYTCLFEGFFLFFLLYPSFFFGSYGWREKLWWRRPNVATATKDEIIKRKERQRERERKKERSKGIKDDTTFKTKQGGELSALSASHDFLHGWRMRCCLTPLFSPFSITLFLSRTLSPFSLSLVASQYLLIIILSITHLFWYSIFPYSCPLARSLSLIALIWLLSLSLSLSLSWHYLIFYIYSYMASLSFSLSRFYLSYMDSLSLSLSLFL